MRQDQIVGTPRDRVDGRAKVTGAARYVADFAGNGRVLHAHVLNSPIARGRITAIDASEAEAFPGVRAVFHHRNRPAGAWWGRRYKDTLSIPGTPLRPLYDDRISHAGEPVALVVAETYEAARHAANLVRVEYAEEPHETDLYAHLHQAAPPREKRGGITHPPSPKGDAAAALAAAPVAVEGHWTIAAEHHNPMEPHATVVMVQPDGALLIHDKIQGVVATQDYVCRVFGLAKDQVRVVAPYLGGGFGSGLRPHYQLFLAVMAALGLGESVKLVLTRPQMFTLSHRPETVNRMAMGARPDGRLTAIRHESIGTTSRYEEHQEAVVTWTNLLHSAPNVHLSQKLVRLDIETPSDMRAPGAPLGTFAAECAADELAEKLGMDPLALRLATYTERDEVNGKAHTSKELRAAWQLGAERFGWRHRALAPRARKEGHEWVGMGLAGAAWEAQMQRHNARVLLDLDGSVTVGVATADIGTGTYTILAQVAAEELGVEMDRVTVLLGDSSLPQAPVSGGSWTAASAGSAVMDACRRLKTELLRLAQKDADSPLVGASLAEVRFHRGTIARWDAPSRGVAVAALQARSGRARLVAEGTAGPDPLVQLRHSSHTHAAVFCEVRVDEDLGQIRVTRMVQAVAAGRILNPKTARSQIIGGAVWGIGMALHEETLADHVLGKWMNHDFAEYHIPVNADVPDIDVIFVEEKDKLTSPLGVKGLGEIGIVGAPAAIANAVWHATGRRVRDLPITIDRALGLTPPRL